MSSPDPTRRFSGRVADYVRYRPGYPEALLGALVEEAGLGAAEESLGKSALGVVRCRFASWPPARCSRTTPSCGCGRR